MLRPFTAFAVAVPRPYRLFSLLVLLAGLWLLGACAQGPYFELASAPALPPHGAAQAKGVILYSHGRSNSVDLGAVAVVPGYLGPSYWAGWDVVLLKRPLVADNRTDATRDLREAIAQVRAQGYKRVVLAGQSAGGWAALDAAGDEKVFAVIATSPAAHGDGPTGTEIGTLYFGDMLRDLEPTRIMLFFFENDPFQTPDRGRIAEQILSERGLTHRVIDRPPGLAGHGAFERRFFTRRFGGEIRDFIEPTGH